MKQRDKLFYLEDMVEAIDKIQRYLLKVDSLEAFQENELIVDAVTRNFEIIGEAANKVPVEIKAKHPQIPWSQMYRLRNFAVHEYHIIDTSILWEIANKNLDKDKENLKQVIEEELSS